MLLYNSSVSGNCYKVRLLLAQLGLEYETVDVSVVDRSNRAQLLTASSGRPMVRNYHSRRCPSRDRMGHSHITALAFAKTPARF